MKRAYPELSNPGPDWGYSILAVLEKYLPEVIFGPLLDAGTLVALLLMREKRRYSAEYWLAVTGRTPAFGEQFRHFRSFMQGLILKLRAGRGKFPEFEFSQDAHQAEFVELCASPRQILFGTFHVGYSDMMGCMLKSFNRQLSMVRLQVRNSLDTEIIGSRFSGFVRFLWINNPEDFIFQLKEAVENGQSIGLQCDRTQFASKMGEFSFLGARRQFPTAIYSLADLFKMPVVFAFTGPVEASNRIHVYTSPVFFPGDDQRKNSEAAAIHFQKILDTLESHLKRHPHLWFNFLPLNKVASQDSTHA